MYDKGVFVLSAAAQDEPARENDFVSMNLLFVLADEEDDVAELLVVDQLAHVVGKEVWRPEDREPARSHGGESG